MKHQVTLTITSSLSILLFSLHRADEVARGMEPRTISAPGGLLMLAVWLFATLAFAEWRLGRGVLPTRALWSLRRGQSK